MSKQTLAKARRLHKEALSSEVQAETYNSLMHELGRRYDAATDATSKAVLSSEYERLGKLRDEFMDDMDDRRGLIDPRWIDSL